MTEWNALEEEFQKGLGRYTIIHGKCESNLDRVAGLIAEDMVPTLTKMIRDRYDEYLGVKSGRSS